MMTRRERLMATLRGERVDRPAVSFYEIGGWQPDPSDPDPFNIYNSPDWLPLLQLAEEETDLIRMFPPDRTPASKSRHAEFFRSHTYLHDGSRYTRQTLEVAGRTMTSLSRRDPGVSTSWALEYLLKNTDDVRAYLQLPDEVFATVYGVDTLRAQEEALGDAGIVMVDVGDPICQVAPLFSMEGYTVLALTEPALFHQLLEMHARRIYPMVESIAKTFPGHLWRVVGSEYASEPFLPPHLYEEYVVRYTKPMVDVIQRHGGYARIHSHGRLRNILPHISSMSPAGLDPVEPPPQGDMELVDVRRQYGQNMVLFGNVEAAWIETLSPAEFEARIARTLQEGTTSPGRGFVLMPSACPYGRHISASVMANYETMIRLVKMG